MRCRPWITRGALGVLIAFAHTACTSTLVSSWKAPDAVPFELAREKVAAVVMTTEEATRRAGEDALARQLSRHGVEGLPMYTLLPNGDVSDEPAARAAAERAGVVGVVVMRPVRIDQKLSGRSTYSGPMHGGYWGGYFGYGWGSPWGTGGVAIRTDTIVTIETLVYSLRENKLLWGGQTRTISPKNLDRLIEDTAKQVANELVRLGLMRRD